MAYPSLASVMGVYGVRPPYEFLHLTGSKVDLQRTSDKLISVSRINKPNFRTISPVQSLRHSLSSSEGRRNDYWKDVAKTKLYKDYSPAKREQINTANINNINYNTQLQRFGSFSPSQRYVNPPTLRTPPDLHNEQHFAHSTTEPKSEKHVENINDITEMSSKPEVKRSESVRELVANILHSVISKTSNTKISDSDEIENPVNDINNNVNPKYTAGDPTHYPEALSTSKVRKSGGEDYYSKYTRSIVPKRTSSKKKNRKSKKTNISSPLNVAQTVPDKSIQCNKTDSNTKDSAMVISKANPVMSNLQKKIEMRRSRSLSHSNTVVHPADSIIQNVYSPIQRRKSLDLDVTPVRQSLPIRRTFEFKRNEDVPIKIHKIYQSKKQTNTVSDMGESVVGAPPATPMPEMLNKVQYIPCMADIRAQRAVKAELEMLQKKVQKRQEKELEEKRQQEKVQRRDAEKKLKIRQRQEIYALNKVMTALENDNFKKFCRAYGIPS